MSIKTTPHLQNLIILENVFCINRSYLLECSKLRLICNIICFTSLIITGSISTFNLVSEYISVETRWFLVFMGLELLGLIAGSRLRCMSFETINKLDEKYGVDGKYFYEIKRRVNTIIMTCVLTAIMDTVGLMFLQCRYDLIFLICVLISAHETEMAFFSLLVQCINMRLANLFDATPNFGSKIYRHVLIAASHLNEEFTPRMLMMYGVTITTTVINAMVVILTESEKFTPRTVYLVWREMKIIYSVWLACAAAAKTEDICNKLTFHLAGRLALDDRVSKDKYSSQHKTLVRWHKTLLSQRPQYMSGSVLSVGLGVPLHLLDLSINYVLIIVQIYLAYQ